jgi:hypothetical protein
MKSNIFIPKKCKVGLQIREGTYTGKLGYVIYHDGKTWRKEGSWATWRHKYISDEEFNKQKAVAYQSHIAEAIKHKRIYTPNEGWKYYDKVEITDEEFHKLLPTYDNYKWNPYKSTNDKTIEPFEFENVPIEGFVLNKKAGGYSSGWNHRQTYCRIYDPRGFEFEVNIPNLLYILENANCMKGKGLEGKFIYGWEGKDLVLIPEDCPEFKEMMEFSSIQDMKVAKKDLVLGGMYQFSNGSKQTYMGESLFYDGDGFTDGKKVMWWYNHDKKYGAGFETSTSVSKVKKFIDINPEYASLMDMLFVNSGYTPREQIFTEVESLPEEVANAADARRTYYIKDKNKFIKVQVTIPYYYNNGFYGSRSRESCRIQEYTSYQSETFASTQSLLNKYKLWELKTTK